MAVKSTTSAPGGGVAPPTTPEPPPYGTTATPCRCAARTVVATSAVLRGRTTQAGPPASRPCRARRWASIQ